MRAITIGLTAALCFPVSVFAQAISNDMTCEEAKSHYEQHGSIETREGNEVLPIDVGVPASKRDELTCGRGAEPEAFFVKTKDSERCAVAFACSD